MPRHSGLEDRPTNRTIIFFHSSAICIFVSSSVSSPPKSRWADGLAIWQLSVFLKWWWVEKLSDLSASTVKTTQSTSDGFISDDVHLHDMKKNMEMSKSDSKWIPRTCLDRWFYPDERWSEKQTFGLTSSLQITSIHLILSVWSLCRLTGGSIRSQSRSSTELINVCWFTTSHFTSSHKGFTVSSTKTVIS